MIFRYARHTNQLNKLTHFYTQVLSFEILGDFKDHDGYNGIFLGLPEALWHLEFTESDEGVNQQFDEDDILVFYPESPEHYEQLIQNIQTLNIPFHTPKNPYWQSNGKLIKDPDGYNIIISDFKIR
ncbi:MAG: VOC family protein [Flavobacteriales bacterium]|nr:VOC family protein [Flavobacteriales bacterium]